MSGQMRKAGAGNHRGKETSVRKTRKGSFWGAKLGTESCPGNQLLVRMEEGWDVTACN